MHKPYRVTLQHVIHFSYFRVERIIIYVEKLTIEYLPAIFSFYNNFISIQHHKTNKYDDNCLPGIILPKYKNLFFHDRIDNLCVLSLKEYFSGSKKNVNEQRTKMFK